MDNTVADLSKPFKDVYEVLDMKDQRLALRGAMRKEGKRLREKAVTNARLSGLGKKSKSETDVTEGIYLRVYPNRYGSGFMLSVKPHGDKAIHVNRQGKKKPVLMWAEDGTRYRRVGKRAKSFFGKSRYTGKNIRYYNRSGRSTGRMKRYAFLEKTEVQEGVKIEQNLFNDFQNNLERKARKKGLL